MNITLFGATGQTGQRVLQRLKTDRHQVRALARNAASLSGSLPDDAIVTGDARDAAAVATALAGSEAVVVCLGLTRITEPSTDHSDAYRTILAGMETAGISRILAMASAGVLDHPRGGLRNEQPGQPPFLRYISPEHARVFRLLAASDRDWTLFCPVTLVDSPSPAYRTSIEDLPDGAEETGYAHVADAMAMALSDSKWSRHRIGIAI